MVKVSITKMPLRKSQVINILRQFIRKIFQNKLNRLKEKINEDEEGGEGDFEGLQGLLFDEDSAP